jgi:ribosomal protein L11 methyltransferase
MILLKVSLESPIENEKWEIAVNYLLQNQCIGINEGEIPPPKGLEALIAYNEFEAALKPTELPPPLEFEAYFNSEQDANLAYSSIKDLLPIKTFSIELVNEQNYSELWKESFKPIFCEPNFLIRASWHEKNHDSNVIELIIEPGMAFGTGSHETTKSCLYFISKAIQDFAPNHVLDFGCGSGILAIALKKLGVKTVDAIDIDPLALEATQNNAKLNKVKINTFQSMEELNYTDKLDGVVANVLKNTLIEYSQFFSKIIKPKGFLILSGLLLEQKKDILDAYLPLGFNLINEIIKQDSSQTSNLNEQEAPLTWLTLYFQR